MGNEEDSMCLLDPDGTAGWFAGCPNAQRCICGYGFPEEVMRPRASVPSVGGGYNYPVVVKQGPSVPAMVTAGLITWGIISAITYLSEGEDERWRRQHYR
jgi:hypothetical protein